MTRINYCIFISFSLIGVFFLNPSFAAEVKSENAHKMGEGNQAFLKAYCIECHNEKKTKGKVRLDNIPLVIKDQHSAKRWQDILDALNGGEMPPEDEKQPESIEKADFLDNLANEMVVIRQKLGDQHGRITMRRLNRREYYNTLKSLIGADIKVSELPADTTNEHFDTDGANMFMSSHQFEQYLALGREALNDSFETYLTRNVAYYKRFEAEKLSERYKTYTAKITKDKEQALKWIAAVKKAAEDPKNAEIVAEIRKETKKNENAFRREWKRIPGAPAPEEFGFNTKENNADKANGAAKPYYLDYYNHYLTLPKIDTGAYLTCPTVHPSQLPTGYLSNFIWSSTPGKYVVRMRVAAKKGGPRSRKMIEFGLDSRSGDVMSSHEVTAPLDAPQVIEFPLTMTTQNTSRESREIYIREKATGYFISNPRRVFSKAKKENGIGPEYLVWVDWIEVEKIPSKQPSITPGLAALQIPLDDTVPKVADDVIYQAFKRFARLAFRESAPPESYLKKLVEIYKYKIGKKAKHSDALKDTLAIILSSPMFLYINEKSKDSSSKSISDLELANRLSYFLWGAPPDESLYDLANSKKLSKGEELTQQAMRLLNHDQAKEFTKAFAYQWLGLDRIDFFQPDVKKFLAFDKTVKRSVKMEVYETLNHLFKNNLSVLDLLKSNYVVIDNVLADFYGIDGVEGDHFRKVAISEQSPRGGFLGMSAIHLMGSNGKHTSPVERGTWVLRKLLNSPPPPAPANVPQISRLSKKVLTARERLLAHQEEPQCASCHRKIDPIGFGLENFDAVGLWREENHYAVKGVGEKTWKVNPAATFHKGPSFKNYHEMRDIIATKGDDFAKGFAKSLLEYSLGRPLGFSDEALVDSIVKQAKAKDYAIREFVIAIIQSKAFKIKA